MRFSFFHKQERKTNTFYKYPTNTEKGKTNINQPCSLRLFTSISVSFALINFLNIELFTSNALWPCLFFSNHYFYCYYFHFSGPFFFLFFCVQNVRRSQREVKKKNHSAFLLRGEKCVCARCEVVVDNREQKGIKFSTREFSQFFSLRIGVRWKKGIFFSVWLKMLFMLLALPREKFRKFLKMLVLEIGSGMLVAGEYMGWHEHYGWKIPMSYGKSGLMNVMNKMFRKSEN